MKDIKNFINESTTRLLDIENYAKSWATSYEPQQFDEVFDSILKGLKRGVEENAKYYEDRKDQKAIEDALKRLDKVK